MTQPHTNLVSAVYWRRNPFLASMMKPLVLTLTGGVFRAVGPDGATLFEAPAASVHGHLGRMGTFKFRVDGRKWVVVGRGSLGGDEQRHTEVQRQYVHEFVTEHPDAAAVQRGPAGAIDTLFNQAAAAKLGVWRDALAAAGASVR